MGGNGVVNHSIASSLRLRAGMGLPVGKHIVPDRPLPVNDELVWDNDAVFRTLYRSHRRHRGKVRSFGSTVWRFELLRWSGLVGRVE
ncbi:hypothetical protein M0R45_018643 [Rubus argutus]|uniref:Uncharacterized protein n=1 Tax=Rubus argutus TaxID=59490 RepID=A0AAW1X370_RUBAR